MCKLVCPICQKIETVPFEMCYADGMCNDCLESDDDDYYYRVEAKDHDAAVALMATGYVVQAPLLKDVLYWTEPSL